MRRSTRFYPSLFRGDRYVAADQFRGPFESARAGYPLLADSFTALLLTPRTAPATLLALMAAAGATGQNVEIRGIDGAPLDNVPRLPAAR